MLYSERIPIQPKQPESYQCSSGTAIRIDSNSSSIDITYPPDMLSFRSLLYSYPNMQKVLHTKIFRINTYTIDKEQLVSELAQIQLNNTLHNGSDELKMAYYCCKGLLDEL